MGKGVFRVGVGGLRSAYGLPSPPTPTLHPEKLPDRGSPAGIY